MPAIRNRMLSIGRAVPPLLTLHRSLLAEQKDASHQKRDLEAFRSLLLFWQVRAEQLSIDETNFRVRTPQLKDSGSADVGKNDAIGFVPREELLAGRFQRIACSVYSRQA